MLKKRLIPKLQMRFSQFGNKNKLVLVTTRQFSKTIEIGDPVSQAKIYQAQSADELIFMDIDASVQGRKPFFEVIKRAAEEIFMPITIGGGVKCLEDFRVLLQNGADKVSVNTHAIQKPTLIKKAAATFGSQSVVLSIDYKKEENGTYRVWTMGGGEKTQLSPVEWAVEGARLGAGEILITSIDRDGTSDGLDIEMTQQICNCVTIPVISSGGCGVASHFADCFLKTEVSAIASGTYFCFKDENPMQTRAQINNAGIPIRMQT